MKGSRGRGERSCAPEPHQEGTPIQLLSRGHAPPQVRAKAREGVPPPLGVPSHLLRPTAWARAWRAGGREGQREGGESHAEVR